MEDDDEYTDPDDTGDGESEELDEEDLENFLDYSDEEENLDDEDQEEDDKEEEEDEEQEIDITSYRTTREIFESGRFTAEERRREYRRRGKGPSGVIDGEYNDTYLDEGEIYNDFDRDWDAEA